MADEKIQLLKRLTEIEKLEKEAVLEKEADLADKRAKNAKLIADKIEEDRLLREKQSIFLTKSRLYAKIDSIQPVEPEPEIDKDKLIETLRLKISKMDFLKLAELEGKNKKLLKRNDDLMEDNNIKCDQIVHLQKQIKGVLPSIDLAASKYEQFHKAIILKQKGGTPVSITLAKHSLTIKDFDYTE